MVTTLGVGSHLFCLAQWELMVASSWIKCYLGCFITFHISPTIILTPNVQYLTSPVISVDI